ncbi:SMP-30/gluconolactonase/LRE family protein [Pseudorhodoferax sp.]|uniref:SMP-30/gluconolactonase/LRE family protein n=1 Tax=Pseudorhodoferax sp. TaxID=1993553 RepID=UPI002DD6A46E|nr:SMP-30/gluconolactonase/LRE family protein [Pseudorhodoferax sp.]
MDTAFREVAQGLRFPEGPVALADGNLLVTEVGGGTLVRIGRDGRLDTVADLGGGPNGAALGPDGACYVCNNGGLEFIDEPGHGLRPRGTPASYTGGSIQRVDLRTGRFETLYEAVDGRRLCGPNDLVFDRQGGFWFTDHGKAHGRRRDFGSVLYARADGSLIREVLFPIATPNGIGLSPDERTLYVADTESARVLAYEIVGEGALRLLPWPAPHHGHLLAALGGRYQRLDSLAVDSEGHVCVATINHAGITRISPDGQRIDHLPTTDILTTNICFGGPDLRTAFVTLSGQGRVVACDWPVPGHPLNFSA